MTTTIWLAAALAGLSILSAAWMWRGAGRLERARLVRGAVLVTAAASVALATLAALRLAERTEVLAGEIETRPEPSGLPLLTAAQVDAIRDRVRQAGLPQGFLFGVYAACGEAQNVAAQLVAALRSGGATVFASPRCGPLGEGLRGGLSLIVNQKGRDAADARRAANILVRAGVAQTTPMVAPIGATAADLIVLVGR